MGVTRRQALVGATVATAGGFALVGRYGVGGTFEQHVADQLGLPRATADGLVQTLRATLERPDYEARASAFVLATTTPARLAMPEGARREAIEAFIGPLLKMENGFVGPYALAGIQDTGRYQPCLLRRDAPARS